MKNTSTYFIAGMLLIALSACSPAKSSTPAMSGGELEKTTSTELLETAQSALPVSTSTPEPASVTFISSPTVMATETAKPLSSIKIDENNYSTLDIIGRINLDFGNVVDAVVDASTNQLILATTKGLAVVDINSFTKLLEVALDAPPVMIAPGSVHGQIGLITKEKAGVFDFTSDQWMVEIPGESFTAIDLYPENGLLALGLFSGEIDLLDAATGEKLKTFEGHHYPITDLDFDITGAYLVSSSKDRTARVWSVLSGNQLSILYGHDQAVMVASFSPNGKYVATGCDDDFFRIFTVSSADIFHRSGTLSAEIKTIDYDPAGTLFALCETKNNCRIYETENWKSKFYVSVASPPMEILFSPQGNLVFIALKDGTVRAYGIR